MGAWGAEILDDDLALDIKAEFDEIMSAEDDVIAATEAVLESFGDCLEDEDEGPVVILTLAYLQARAGNLLEPIGQRALEIIESGEGLNRWDEEEQLLADRKRALDELKKLIQNSLNT